MPEAPPDNVFARILRGELPSHCVYEDDASYAFLDIYPQAAGHTIIIPKRYSENLIDADSSDLHRTLATVRLLAPLIARVCAAAGFTVLTNTGKDAGQMIQYLHWHIIPRNSSDQVSLHQLGQAADNVELAELAGRIRAELETVQTTAQGDQA